jgi:hypothetical protein
MSNLKCECPETGVLRTPSLYDPITELPFVDHQPRECKCSNNLRMYRREGKLLLLCSCCHTFGDEEVQGQ